MADRLDDLGARLFRALSDPVLIRGRLSGDWRCATCNRPVEEGSLYCEDDVWGCEPASGSTYEDPEQAADDAHGDFLCDLEREGSV